MIGDFLERKIDAINDKFEDIKQIRETELPYCQSLVYKNDAVVHNILGYMLKKHNKVL